MLKYASLTDSGCRERNEDSIIIAEHGAMSLFVVCDGLGGHGSGDVASSLVCEVMENQFKLCYDSSSFLGESFSIAQDVLIGEQIAQHARNKMKTTCVALIVDKDTARIGHIGDSRLYIFNHNRIKKRTLDHSIPQMLVLSHRLKDSQIRNHPERSMVMRVMGVEWESGPQYELMNPIPLKKCQAFLLCTDGFWELIEDNEMEKCLRLASEPQEWIDLMTDIVKANGIGKNMDNYSAIAVWNEAD